MSVAIEWIIHPCFLFHRLTRWCFRFEAPSENDFSRIQVSAAAWIEVR